MEAEPARKRRRTNDTAPTPTKRVRRKPRVSPLTKLKRDLRTKERLLKGKIRELKKELTVVTRDRKRTSRC